MMGETPRDLTLADATALTRSYKVRRIAPINVGAAEVSYSGRSRDVVKFDLFAKRTPGRDVDDQRFGPRPRVDRSGEPVGFERLGRVRVRPAGAGGRVDIGRGAGRITTLALRAGGKDVYIRTIRITYGNGQRDRITVERSLREGRISPAILLDCARFVRLV